MTLILSMPDQSPRQKAGIIIAWMKSQPYGTSFSWPTIFKEVTRRWPYISDDDAEFVCTKAIHLLAME